MSVTNIKAIDRLKEICSDYETLRVEKIGEDIWVVYAKMYESPEMTINHAIALKELFGCYDVKIDGYSHAGCDTCDYGSSYGHEIQIVKPTKNTDIVGDHGTSR